jgi:hypothetical protein
MGFPVVCVAEYCKENGGGQGKYWYKGHAASQSCARWVVSGGLAAYICAYEKDYQTL